MEGSYVFLLHLVGFSFVCAVQIVQWTLYFRFLREKEWKAKLGLLETAALFKYLSSTALVIIVITGIGNIYNRYLGSPESWTTESWLVAKIILVLFLIVSGNYLGPLLGEKRGAVVRNVIESQKFGEGENLLRPHNTRMVLFLVSQSILLLAILSLSVFGDGKHPGVF